MPLPEVQKKVRGFAWFCGCKKIIKYNTAEAPLLLVITFTQSLAKQTRKNLLAQRISYIWSAVEYGRREVELHSAAAQMARAKSHVSH